MSHSMNTYSRIPIAFTRGERVWVWDESGKKYLDALAGIAVNTLGHGHAKLTRAIAEQSSRLIHTSNLYRIAEQERLADKLAAISGMDGVFFCNSGCEANEAAIKLARLIAASLASQPELQKNTPSMPLIAASLSASLSCSAMR